MSTTGSNFSSGKHAASLSFLLLVVVAVYWRGLFSAFMFDDFVNLDALVNVSGSLWDPNLWDFVAGGTAGPLGRPLSLLSFALQAASWPDNAFVFKLVNLLIHAVNTALVYCLCVKFARSQNLSEEDLLLLAGFCTAIWALHPLHVTAVLYTIQRMTLLCSTFMLSGLLCYLHWRPQINATSTWKDLLPLTLGLGITAVLALLSKENAASLLLYVMALEYTIFGAHAVNLVFKRWRALVLWLPLAVLVASTLVYVMTTTDSFIDKLGFSRTQRVLSEARILWTYLGHLFAPGMASTQLFHSPSVSTSLFSPITTLLACGAWLLVVAGAFFYRHKQPVLALAALWFLAGHSIEGSVIPLELYFNHRNYLAILGPLLAVVYVLLGLRHRLPESVQGLLLAIPLLMVLVNAGQTVANASVWSTPKQLAKDWYQHDPQEVRNAEFYAISVARVNARGAQEASDVYDAILQNNPTLLRPLFNRMLLTCISPTVSLPESAVVSAHIANSKSSEMDLLSPLNQLVEQSLAKQCATVTPAYLEEILQTALPRLSKFNQPTALFALGRIREAASDNAAAVQFYDQAFALSLDAGILFAKAILQMNMEDPQAALTTVATAITTVLDHNDIATGSREQKLNVLYEMQRDAQDRLNSAGKTATP